MRDGGLTMADIESYWLEAGVPRNVVAEMRQELEQHIADAEADGRTLSDIVGPDPGGFAESWAEAYRGRRGTPTWADVRSGSTARRRANRKDLWMYGTGIVAMLVAAVVAGQGGNEVENEVWRWLWTIFALVMGIGEMFTAGFFLLPFAIGAGIAAILAWVSAPVVAQWLVFFGVSIVSMAYLRRFIDRQDEGDQPVVGANRWVSRVGVVLEDIDPLSGAGMVKVEAEEWRATADQHISKGTQIIVTEVRGTRFVVEPLQRA